jgi:hypothetical protein
MSGAERQRRYLDRRLQSARTDTALIKQLAQARAELAQARTELAKAMAAPRDNKDDRIAELETGGQAQAGADVVALQTEMAGLKLKFTKLAEDRDAWKRAYDDLDDRYRRKPRILCRPELHRQIKACLHPDRAGEASAKWFREFSEVEFIEIKPRPKSVPTKEEIMAASLKAAAERNAKAKQRAEARRKK